MIKDRCTTIGKMGIQYQAFGMNENSVASEMVHWVEFRRVATAVRSSGEVTQVSQGRGDSYV